MKDLEDYIEQYRPKSGQYAEERGGRAAGIGIMVGLFRLSEAIETAAQTIGNSIEYASERISNELSDGR